MINDNQTTPPYHIGDLYAPEGLSSLDYKGMVVSVTDSQHGCAVYLDLMEYDFTDVYSINEVFEKYHLNYNKKGAHLSPEHIKRTIINDNEEVSRLLAYNNGIGKFLLPTIDELKSFFNNISIYYKLRQEYYPHNKSLDIENNCNCRYFISRTLNADATEVYIYDVRKRESYSVPINSSMYYVNAIYVLEYYDDGHREVQTHEDRSGCYVATAVYGSYNCPEVWALRRFRDNILHETWYGRAFIQTYYAISPTLVKWFGETSWFKKLWRRPLDKLVTKLKCKGVEDTPYSDKY